jgi:hypothetical protein
MDNSARLIPISVIRLHNRGSKIGKGKGAADSVGRAKANDKANDKAKENARDKAAVGDVRTACEGLKAVANAACKVNDRGWGNEVPAVVRVVARLAILSFWLLIRTAMANCRPAKSPAQPHH